MFLRYHLSNGRHIHLHYQYIRAIVATTTTIFMVFGGPHFSAALFVKLFCLKSTCHSASAWLFSNSLPVITPIPAGHPPSGG
jgi:hypothetical protein